EITDFRFTAMDNESLTDDVVGTIDQGTGSIRVLVPYGTDINALVASISSSPGASVSPGAGSQNYSNPLVYRVTAADGSTSTYTVYVTLAKNSEKEITDFRF